MTQRSARSLDAWERIDRDVSTAGGRWFGNGQYLCPVALGFILIFKATDVVNFAQGELMMVSTFFAKTMIDRLHPADVWMWLAVVLLTIGFAALFGVILERLIIRPLMHAPELCVEVSPVVQVTTMIGISGG